MPHLPGVHLLPATGEFTYDTVAYEGRRVTENAASQINSYSGQAPTTDYSVSLDQLQAAHPECATVSLVVAWFCDSTIAGSCNIYPSTTYIGGTFQTSAGGADDWRCSGLTQSSPDLIPIPTNGSGNFIYGGTPSDQSIVRCIQDLRARGLRVVFYPFLLLTAPGLPWRGRITYSPDVSGAATAAVNSFLGSAAPSQFTRDSANLTVAYAGPSVDWTYRRMILHYANLCVVAGGVNLFVIGSELRGLETIRGPAWTKAGTIDSSGNASWDYPFVAGLAQLASDVRDLFDSAGYARNSATPQNLITYSADWSSWMGWQHPGESGQWPHLDSLFASASIDFVSLDNYLPLSDWTTSERAQDVALWGASAPVSWPPSDANSVGLGLSGAPTIYSKAYLKANIEGGCYFNWYYGDSTNRGAGLDPNGSGLYISQPEGDRALQGREPYYAGQQILANKQLRWWWNNDHRAIYDSGSGWISQGPKSAWAPNSKPILFLEYGVPSIDKATNQPNVFYNPASIESFTAYWSAWQSVPNQGLAPVRDDTISSLALDSIYEYWNTDAPANTETVGGVPMLQFAFCCVWNWDARPFPTFPLLTDVWGDAPQWQWGNWLSGKGPFSPPVAPSADPAPGSYPTFPTLATVGWSVHVSPRWASTLSTRVSGREARAQRRRYALYDIELTYDLLRADSNSELETIAGFYLEQGGEEALFWFAPPGLSLIEGQALGTGDGSTTTFPLTVDWIGGFVEPVLATSGVTAVYLDGAAQDAGWSVSNGYAPVINLATAPASGVFVTADFIPLWLCRFAEDVADFENFMALLWHWQGVKLQTVRP